MSTTKRPEKTEYQIDKEALATRTVDRDERVRIWLTLIPILFLAMAVIAGQFAEALLDRLADWVFRDEPKHPENEVEVK